MVLRRLVSTASAALTISLALGCSSSPSTPTSPGGVAPSDLSDSHEASLKVGQPTLLGPANGAIFEEDDTVTVTFQTAQGLYVNVPVAHELVVRRASDGVELYRTTLGASAGTVSHTLPSPPDISEDTTFEWQVRGAMGDARGPWSATRSFVIEAQGIGPPRTISTEEAIDMIINLHNVERWNLGHGSTREDRVDFLWRAVAVLHYGHPLYNPAGPDPDWCVKDAGAGRPPSDDVIVRCSSREAWDILLSAGGDYHFHQEYLGRLGREQNVYAPPQSSLPR